MQVTMLKTFISYWRTLWSSESKFLRTDQENKMNISWTLNLAIIPRNMSILLLDVIFRGESGFLEQ